MRIIAFIVCEKQRTGADRSSQLHSLISKHVIPSLECIAAIHTTV